MDDFPGLLARDFGFKPQGKSAPMAPPRSSSSGHNNNTFSSSSANFGLGSDHHRSSSSSSFKNSNNNNSNNNKSNAIFDDHDRDGLLFNDVFGGPPRYTSPPTSDSRGTAPPSSGFDYDYDSIFKDQNAKSASMPPVFDKPVYDDDIFDGLPGIKSSTTSSNIKYDDVFASISASSPPQPSKPKTQSSSPFDDLLGNLGKKETESKTERVKVEKDSAVFDDLIPGFGGSSSSQSTNRSTSESSRFQKPASASTKTASSAMDDPFVVLESTSTPAVSSSGMFTESLEEISKFSSSGNTRADSSVRSGVFDDIDPLDSLGKSVPPVSSETNKRGKDQSPLRTGGKSGAQSSASKVFDDIDPFDGLGKSIPPVSSETNKRGKDRSPLRTGGKSGAQSSASKEPIDKTPVESTDGHSQKRVPVDNFQESHQTLFDMPNVSTDFRGSVGQTASPPSYMNASPNETNSQANTTQRSEEIFESSDDVWLTVSEIPLFTQPTRAPPPSRPPPPRPTRVSKSETGSFSSTNARKKVNEFSSFPNSTQYTHSPKSTRAAARSSVASQMDEFEDFAMGRARNNVNEHAEVLSGDDVDSNSVAAASAAAMKEAMDRAEAKFRHAKEMREREYLKATRSKEALQQDKDEDSELREKQERLDRERQQREREEEEREQRRLEKERERAREIEREREEEEREMRRLERERIAKERELARQAVERATREARERAAAEARLKAERAAVGKVSAEARVRAERAAVQRAQAEARERAAVEARERAEKAAAEARERANAESREREVRDRDRAQRAAAEARERAAADARERAAAAARANQQKNDDDLESFFGMGSRASSAPRPRANSSDPMFDAQSKGVPDATRRTSVGSSSSMKKASSTTNIVDDLTSIFGGAAASSSGDFQEVEGESEERRRARMDRHQRTQERAAKALAEKNQRDLQAQRDQAERHRIAETLDVEIKRWAAGKEGNLRALLSTLQYVLWPECGWQPVSLTDLITAAAVKKVYRKATLCIHPDKVQQKGANLQQKYVAEKVFDLLKEAWNKFNSEELF